MLQNNLLNLLIACPILGAIAALFFREPNKARVIALITAILCLGLSFYFYAQFNSGTADFQFQSSLNWIPVYGIHYAVGIDGLSLPLIMLTCFTTLAVILASWRSIRYRVAEYMAAFLVMQSMMVGTFAAMDSILFYIFWEAMLIPMYLSIGIWGGQDRAYAALKFFVYTFLGSALMLVALIYLGLKAHSFLITDFYTLKLSLHEQLWLFLAFLLAFAVKLPMWPLHTWLPDAHTEAPSGGSVVLAALMLKMGAYGFLRFTLPILPDASVILDKWMLILALIAIIYIAIVALAQTDIKRLIAYSSISHMGFVTLGCFMIFLIVQNTHSLSEAYLSLEGAMVQMIAHALSSGALFLGFGILADRLKSRNIADYGGVAHTMPICAAFFMLFAMTNVGLPGTAGFVGEFMILLSAAQANLWITAGAGTVLVLAAAYTLSMYKRVFFGAIKPGSAVAQLQDVRGTEIYVFILLGLAIIFLGFYPAPLLNMMHASVGHILQLSLQTKL